MIRALALALVPLTLALGCVASRTASSLEVPALTPAGNSLAQPEVALPFHSARIVDLALPTPGPGERWRMVSGDIDGWVRFWADERMIAAAQPHPGGLAALVTAPDGTLYTAGFDGRVREWPSGATTPSRTFRFGKQVTALAVSEAHLAISDGQFVQLWTRADPPQLEWTTRAEAFVTGLALSRSGSLIAAAELRESAMRDGIATHPLATFAGSGLRTVEAERAAELAYLAERDFPGAAADFVEVWQPSRDRGRQLIPQAPIDSDIGIFPPGGVAYREIVERSRAAVIGRRLEDRAHVSLSLVKPWALFSGKSEGQPGEQSDSAKPADSMVNVGDFVMGPEGEIIVVDHFPGWDQPPPAWGWRVGERRELAIARGLAALGDGLGNVALIDLAQPTEPGWQAAGEERPELLAVAPNQPWIATATLEPRTQYRLWSLADGLHRAIRVEDPGSVVGEALAEQSGVEAVAMYPIALALDDDHRTLAVSLSSFGEPAQAGVRLITTADGSVRELTFAPTPHPIELALSPDAAELIAWTPGFSAFRWSGVDWSPLEAPAPSGAPRISTNGQYAAHVSSLERTVVNRESGATVVAKVDPVVSEHGSAIPAALADDGMLAVVDPFGGGTVQLLAVDGSQAAIQLPGAATALAWVVDREGQSVLVVGFQDGSIVRVDRAAETTIPIHAGTGGRIWGLAPLGGRPGVFVELDELGLALHRLDDDALLELHLADATTLARHLASAPDTDPSGVDLVAIWRPGTAMPACVILDGSRAGVRVSGDVRRVGLDEGPLLFDAFASGRPCPKQPPPGAIEPVLVP